MGPHDGHTIVETPWTFRCKKRGIKHGHMRTIGLIRRSVFISMTFFLLWHWGCSKEPVAKIGEMAQDFTLPSLTGGKITLSRFRGKNVLLLFWTEGCVFCQTDNIVEVNDIYLKGKDAGLEVLSINIADPKGDVREFTKQKGLIFPVLLDRYASVTRKKYGVYRVPTLFIIGKDGIIKDKAYGYLSKDGLMNFTRPYLTKAP